MKKGLIGTAALGLLVFVAANMYPIIHGPEITIKTLSDGETRSEAMVRLTGKARFTKDLVINGTPLATAPDGSFEDNLVLNPGYNLITVSGKDRFGTTSQSSYSVMLKEDKVQVLTLRPPLPRTN